MIKYLLILAFCAFQGWFFYQFYKSWKQEQKLRQDMEDIHSQMMRTFGDTK